MYNKLRDGVNEIYSNIYARKYMDKVCLGRPIINSKIVDMLKLYGYNKLIDKSNNYFKVGLFTPTNEFYGTENLVKLFVKYYSSGNSNFRLFVRNGARSNYYKLKCKNIEPIDYLPQEEFFKLMTGMDYLIIDMKNDSYSYIALEGLYLGIPVLFKMCRWIYDIVPKDYPFVYDRDEQILGFLDIEVYNKLIKKVDIDTIRKNIEFYFDYVAIERFNKLYNKLFKTFRKNLFNETEFVINDKLFDLIKSGLIEKDTVDIMDCGISLADTHFSGRMYDGYWIHMSYIVKGLKNFGFGFTKNFKYLKLIDKSRLPDKIKKEVYGGV